MEGQSGGQKTWKNWLRGKMDAWSVERMQANGRYFQAISLFLGLCVPTSAQPVSLCTPSLLQYYFCLVTADRYVTYSFACCFYWYLFLPLQSLMLFIGGVVTCR